jgi:Uma2 family endonuclease
MVAASAFPYVSPEDYLAAETTSPIKHEYRDGEVYAMAGGTDAHVTIALNLWALLRGHLRNQGCRAYALDMKARIEALNGYQLKPGQVDCARDWGVVTKRTV